MAAEQKTRTARPKANGKPEVADHLDKGAVARTEPKAKPKSIKWHKHEFKLPAEVPNEVALDVVTAQAGDQLADFRILYSILGPDQFMAVRNEVAEDQDSAETLGKLLEDILGKYGVELGE